MTIDSFEMTKIAEGWIAYNLDPNPPLDEINWSFGRLNQLIRKAPEDAWNVILLIRQMNGSESILAVLAAGPLENLLVAHGDEIIERVENLAKSDAQFRKILGAVWRNAIPESIWTRVRAVAGPSW